MPSSHDQAILDLVLQFLNVHDDELENRYYLVQKILPKLMLSLRKLLHEVERRNLIKDGELDLLPKSLGPDVDTYNRKQSFDSINWIAQSLYRNNSGAVDKDPYSSQLAEVSKMLKFRLGNWQAEQAFKQTATKLKAVAADEKKDAVKKAIKRLRVTALLNALYQTWTSKYFRLKQYLISTEIVRL